MIAKTNNRFKNWEGFVAFSLASLFIAIILQYSGVLFNAKYSLLKGDLLEEYIPAIRNLCRDIMNCESIFFSWNTELGINTSLLNSFFAFSPFNVFYLLLYNSDINMVTAFLIIIRTGLAAYCFQRFISEVHEVNGLISVAFALFYSLCSYQISFNVINIMWLDAMFVLPMVFVNIHRVIKGDKIIGLCFWYAYIFISQFYMGYMIGIVSFCYFVLWIIIEKNSVQVRWKMHTALKYLVSVLIAIGISAFNWLPTLLYILNNNSANSSIHMPIGTDIIDVFFRLLWGQYSWMDSQQPTIYCGVLTLLLLPCFIISKHVGKKEKIIYISLIGVMVFACIFDPVYMIMHGFDNPDGWLFRFSFIMCFLLCTVAAIVIVRLDKQSTLLLLLTALGEAVLVAVLGVGDSHRLQGVIESKWLLIVNILLLLTWATLMWRFLVGVGRDRHVWLVLTLCLTIVELLSEAFILSRSIGGWSKELYDVWYSSGSELVDSESFDDRYRMSDYYSICTNSGTLWGYPTVSYFTSSEKPTVRYVLGQLGLYSSPRMVLNHGLTPVTKMLLGIRYDMYNGLEKVLLSDYNEEQFGARFEENSKILTLGYMVGGNIKDYDFYGENAFENNNYLLSVMTGDKDIRVFEQISYDRVRFLDEGVNIERTDSGYRLSTHGNGSEQRLVINIDELDCDNVYSYFYNDRSGKKSELDYYLLQGGYENEIEKLGDIRVSYIKKMEKTDEGYTLMISPVGNIRDAEFQNMFFYTCSETALDKAYSYLSDNQMVIDVKKDGYIHARVNVDDDKTILFTTIPYDKGWNARINGISTKIEPIMNQAFISVLLPYEGEYEIEFEFKAYGAIAGTIISLVSVLICAVGIVRDIYLASCTQ